METVARADENLTYQKVVVVGGGLAGLTASKYLIDAGYEVVLLEKRPILGGKVSAWKDQEGDWVETGLHAFFGAYEEIYTLMKELGIYDHILWKKHELQYTLSGGERFSFATVNLPSPFHLLPAAFKNRYFTLRERLTLVKALGPMLFGSAKYFTSQDKFTYEQWHLRWGISKRMLKKMFMPMALALKFLPADEISAKIVLDVIGIFLRKNTASKMGLLKGSPNEYLTGPIADYISGKGGIIRKEAKLGLYGDGGTSGQLPEPLEGYPPFPRSPGSESGGAEDDDFYGGLALNDKTLWRGRTTRESGDFAPRP